MTTEVDFCIKLHKRWLSSCLVYSQFCLPFYPTNLFSIINKRLLTIFQQIKYAFASIFKASILKDLETCDDLILAIKTEGFNDSTVEKIQRHIKIFQSSLPSFEKIIQDWKQYRGSYPDIVEPLLANVAQFLYGFKLKLFSIKRVFVKLTYATLYEIDLETELTNLVVFPSLNGNTASLNGLVDCYTLQRTGPFVANILCAQQPNYIKEETNVKYVI